jgi:hypothetical protein
MAAKTKAQKVAEAATAEEARRAALTQEERDAEDAAAAANGAPAPVTGAATDSNAPEQPALAKAPRPRLW